MVFGASACACRLLLVVRGERLVGGMVSSTVLTLAVKSPRGAHRNVAIANEQTGGEPAVAAVR